MIYTVQATDDDIITPFNEVTLSIEQGFDNSDQMFTINSRGQVIARRDLSTDNSEVSMRAWLNGLVYDLVILMTECGNPKYK